MSDGQRNALQRILDLWRADAITPEEQEARDIMALADTTQELADTYAAFRNALIQRGFSPEQAGALVVSFHQSLAAEAIAEAGNSLGFRNDRRN